MKHRQATDNNRTSTLIFAMRPFRSVFLSTIASLIQSPPSINHKSPVPTVNKPA